MILDCLHVASRNSLQKAVKFFAIQNRFLQIESWQLIYESINEVGECFVSTDQLCKLEDVEVKGLYFVKLCLIFLVKLVHEGE